MRGLMDECTHLKNFSVPFNTSLIIALCAKNDGYVPREGCSKLEDIWPGATVRYLEGGHVSSYIKYLDLFRYKNRSVFFHTNKHNFCFRNSIMEGFGHAKQYIPSSKMN